MSTTTPMRIQIEDSWKEALSEEFEKLYFQELRAFLKKEKEEGYDIYPPGPLIFNAFNLTPLPKVKVLLLGQDPYHGKGQAHGLSFSVPDGVKQPPSLQNIFKELEKDLGIPRPAAGNLTPWAEQGVMLLNALLTVRAGQPASHHNKGWEMFTNAVIQKISDTHQGVVFLLWGKFAQQKEVLIDTNKHHVLKAAHPSPYSADSGFFGCKHFSKTNDLLGKAGKKPIDWSLS